MKYYVEINGESSLNIQGLAIQSLPAISKPLMRSKRTEIDGRDGDIITKLGYSAYDKTLKIGLWGNYDINQVIAFFNQEGVITFSNEPDKYYNFTILNREDYINQLEAFREASITIHCQPYKYELNEQPVELENEYVEQEGTSLSFNNSLVAPMNIDLKGNTLQNGTPTPSTPIPINNVSGDNDIVVFGKNLIDVSKGRLGNWGGLTLTSSSNGELIVNGTNSSLVDVYLYIADQYNIGLVNYLNSRTGTYTLSNDKNFETYFRLQSGFKQTTATISPQDTTINCFIRIPAGTYNNYAIKIMLNEGTSAKPYEAYNGTTYNIDLPVENLFDKDNANMLNNMFINGSGVLTSGNGNTSLYIPCKPNTSYTISKIAGNVFRVGTCASTPVANTQLSNYTDNATGSKISITTASTSNYLVVFLRNVETAITLQDILNSLQIEKGLKSNTYTPYGTTPIELNKIGTYQDYIYKENDKWYLHKETGKYTFTGDETFNLQNSNKRIHIINANNQLGDILKTTGGSGILYGMYSNKLEEKTAGQTWSGIQGISYDYNSGANQEDIDISINGLTTIEQYKSAINGITMCFILNTPTNTEITYTPLIEQLESIKNAMSKEGTTNVNQVNNDAPFIITASVLSGSNSVVVNNKGNIYSKPIMTIYGSGNIGVYLSDSQIFSINLGDEEYITLDTANMEAYKVGVLKNRLVSGDYNSFKLETGNNTISFTGNVEKVEIQNYSRWI